MLSSRCSAMALMGLMRLAVRICPRMMQPMRIIAEMAPIMGRAEAKIVLMLSAFVETRSTVPSSSRRA